MTEFKERLSELTEDVTGRIQAYLPKTGDFQKDLTEAMEYSVMNGGKRLRPILMLLTYRYLGGERSEEATLVNPFLAAIEMIHSYSLVHDDLPAMDNDQYRRGKLTTHAKYGHAMGILAGDGLLNAAFETALCATGTEQSEKRILPALRVLARKAGAFGMVGGQTVDVEKTGRPLTEEEIDFIYRLKTGALLEAAMMVGAILAGASEDTVSRIETVASKIGTAFQIRDDILDITSTTEELGKPVGSDERNEKTTYVTLHGMEASEEAVKQCSEQAIELLRTTGTNAEQDDFLETLLNSLITRKK